MRGNYGFSVFWSKEDQGFIATCPDFPGLSGFGETQDEAVQEAQVALEGFVESMEEHGEALPEVTVQPDCSGQTRLRLPASLHNQLALSAKRDGVSLNQYMVYLLAERNATRNAVEQFNTRMDKLEGAVRANNSLHSALIQMHVPVQERESTFFFNTQATTRKSKARLIVAR